MAYKTLHEQYEATANAIRTKRGTTEKISPQDFPNEIMQISTGGEIVYEHHLILQGTTDMSGVHIYTTLLNTYSEQITSFHSLVTNLMMLGFIGEYELQATGTFGNLNDSPFSVVSLSAELTGNALKIRFYSPAVRKDVDVIRTYTASNFANVSIVDVVSEYSAIGGGSTVSAEPTIAWAHYDCTKTYIDDGTLAHSTLRVFIYNAVGIDESQYRVAFRKFTSGQARYKTEWYQELSNATSKKEFENGTYYVFEIPSSDGTRITAKISRIDYLFGNTSFNTYMTAMASSDTGIEGGMIFPKGRQILLALGKNLMVDGKDRRVYYDQKYLKRYYGNKLKQEECYHS